MIRRSIFFLYAAILLCPAASGLAEAHSELADAVMKGDKAAVRNLIRQKADVNAAQVDGTTALHWAVYRDDVESVNLLIGAGAAVDAKNRDGITPLHLSALYGNAAVVKELLKGGADAKQKGPAGETMLMLAARNGSVQTIQLFAEAGADVNAKEPLRGTTALMWAAEQKHPAAVKALLDAHADFAVKSASAGVPRNYMASRVDTEAVKAHAERQARAAAAGRTYAEQLQWETANGIAPKIANRRQPAPSPPAGGARAATSVPPPPRADADATDDQEVVIAGLVGSASGGLTALAFAAREGDLESAKILLDAGANVNQPTNYGWTPLLIAANNRHYRLASYLIEQGANVNLANKGDWTPLYLATDNRNIEGGDFPVPKPDMDNLEFIKILLDHGAQPNARVKDNTLSRTIFTMQWFFESGATAFVRAAQSGDTALLKLLLAYGADPMAVTDHGDTALTAAAGIGWVEGVTYEKSAKDNLEAIKLLLDLGLDPNHANHDGRTPLMGAALKGRNEVVQFLVDHGAKLDTRDGGSRDTENLGAILAGHTFQALDYADGLVRVGVQSAIARPETSALIRKLMTERGMTVPPPNRTVDSVCIVEICKERLPQ
jgi:ankyrin repeat protein